MLRCDSEVVHHRYGRDHGRTSWKQIPLPHWISGLFSGSSWLGVVGHFAEANEVTAVFLVFTKTRWSFEIDFVELLVFVLLFVKLNFVV